MAIERSEVRVLVVDDDADLLDAVIHDVQELGYQTLGARSALEAWSVLMSERVHIVLSDIRMPDGDGESLLNQIAESSEINPSVIMMTGYPDLDKDLLLKYGAIEILDKPIDFNRLAAVLDQARPKDK